MEEVQQNGLKANENETNQSSEHNAIEETGEQNEKDDDTEKAQEDDENELDRFIEREFKQKGDTFITEVRVIDDSGRGEGVGKRERNAEEDDLGIYEDNDVGDDLSDTEQELERLREEKKARDEEERKERERVEAEKRAAELERQERERTVREELEAQREAQEVREAMALAVRETSVEEVTPRLDAGATSKLSPRTWSDPRYLQGLSLREMVWRTAGAAQDATNMANELELSM